MIIVDFNKGDISKTAYGAWQYDYGQALRIQGLDLPTAVEVHFSLQERGGEAVTRIGTTRDRATDVIIPDSMLENGGIAGDYSIYAFVYLTGSDSGRTERKIILPVKSRPRPEAFDNPEDAELFRETIRAVNESADRAEAAEASAEAWTHGGEDYPDRAEDNARYYADQARDTAAGIPGQVEDAKREIGRYVTGKEAELKGDTGDVSFASFAVIPPILYMFNDRDKTHIEFSREGSRLFYRPYFPERM